VNCVVQGLIGTPRPTGQARTGDHLIHRTITGERGRPEDRRGNAAIPGGRVRLHQRTANPRNGGHI